MSNAFESIHNHHERAVLEAISAAAARFPQVSQPEMLADVACVALNRLPPRYIRHAVDLAFYMTDDERADTERAVNDAVNFAFEFVQARVGTPEAEPVREPEPEAQAAPEAQAVEQAPESAAETD